MIALEMLALGMPGPLELGIVAFIAVLLFGRKLPGIARSIGSSIVEFKKGLKDVKDDVSEPVKELKDDVKEIKDALESK